MPSRAFKSRKRVARPDTVDFRDRMYVPTLVEVPERIDLAAFKNRLKAMHTRVKVLDQGEEGACTGFALAAVVHFLLQTRTIEPESGPVSPHMLYAMARRYDEWRGEDYDGSSARGAMKGWHKHGVCGRRLWTGEEGPSARRSLTDERAADALKRPLGAYFRVNHKDLVAMHAAIAEVGILYATASVHQGWDEPDRKTGLIEHVDGIDGGHAFAIVGYDHRGFWIQNSWGSGWGKGGFGLLTYEDWLENGMDAWVARLGVPIELASAVAASRSGKGAAALARQSGAYAHRDLRPHVISIGNDGRLRASGPFATTDEDVETIFEEDVARITRGWAKKRILLYAHGGLVGEAAAIERVADYREALLDNQIYPLAFVWKTDGWTTLKNILRDVISRRRAEGVLDASKDFLLDRLDDTLEPVARALTGKAQWDEMKENALLATTSADGGARKVLQSLSRLAETDASVEVHVVGHSAGSIFLAPVVWSLTADRETKVEEGSLRGCEGLGLRVKTCTLWAPACTIDLFDAAYVPAIKGDRLGQFTLFTLTDEAEQDDHCAHIYHKSLLYLVSNAFEEHPRIPVFRPEGEPILGMAKFIRGKVRKLFDRGKVDWIQAPNEAKAVRDRSSSRSHGSFDDDLATVNATLARMLGHNPKAQPTFPSSASALRDRRQAL